MTGYKPPKAPTLPPMPSDKEEQYKSIISEAILMLRPVQFTYSTDKHTTWRAAIPCKVGTLKNWRLAMEGHNPDWRPAFKLFNLRDMDNLQVQEDRTFNSMAVPYPYSPLDERFERIDAAV